MLEPYKDKQCSIALTKRGAGILSTSLERYGVELVSTRVVRTRYYDTLDEMVAGTCGTLRLRCEEILFAADVSIAILGGVPLDTADITTVVFEQTVREDSMMGVYELDIWATRVLPVWWEQCADHLHPALIEQLSLPASRSALLVHKALRCWGEMHTRRAEYRHPAGFLYVDEIRYGRVIEHELSIHSLADDAGMNMWIDILEELDLVWAMVHRQKPDRLYGYLRSEALQTIVSLVARRVASRRDSNRIASRAPLPIACEGS